MAASTRKNISVWFSENPMTIRAFFSFVNFSASVETEIVLFPCKNILPQYLEKNFHTQKPRSSKNNCLRFSNRIWPVIRSPNLRRADKTLRNYHSLSFGWPIGSVQSGLPGRLKDPGGSDWNFLLKDEIWTKNDLLLFKQKVDNTAETSWTLAFKRFGSSKTGTYLLEGIDLFFRYFRPFRWGEELQGMKEIFRFSGSTFSAE